MPERTALRDMPLPRTSQNTISTFEPPFTGKEKVSVHLSYWLIFSLIVSSSATAEPPALPIPRTSRGEAVAPLIGADHFLALGKLSRAHPRCRIRVHVLHTLDVHDCELEVVQRCHKVQHPQQVHNLLVLQLLWPRMTLNTLMTMLSL